MGAVVLDGTGGDFGGAHRTEEGNEREAPADAVPLDPFGAALALSDDGAFLGELLRRLGDGVPGLEEAGGGFAAKCEEPVLGEGPGEGQVLLLGGGAVLPLLDGGKRCQIRAIGR